MQSTFTNWQEKDKPPNKNIGNVGKNSSKAKKYEISSVISKMVRSAWKKWERLLVT